MWRTDYAVISLDLQTLKEKDLGIQHVPTIATTFVKALRFVLIDEANALFV